MLRCLQTDREEKVRWIILSNTAFVLQDTMDQSDPFSSFVTQHLQVELLLYTPSCHGGIACKVDDNRIHRSSTMISSCTMTKSIKDT